MNKLIARSIFATIFTSAGCSALPPIEHENHVFKNGYGDEIIITTDGATISGRHYQAKSCSTRDMRCVKFGTSFAIMAPLVCDPSYPYDWRAAGGRSVFMAPTPHNPRRVLLSTTYGGLVAFVYEGQRGVIQLYYDPSINIGEKSVWSKLEYFDPDRVQYTKVGGGSFFSCITEARKAVRE